MGLFSKPTCPIEDSYLKVYGIPAPKKWKPEDCPECQYQEKGKCNYAKMLGQQEQYRKRGQPALIKRGQMSDPPAKRQKAEAEALKKVGFSADEQKEYWTISARFDTEWESADQMKRKDILDHLDQWRVYLEKGVSPAKAYVQVEEWLKQREEFKKRT